MNDCNTAITQTGEPNADTTIKTDEEIIEECGMANLPLIIHRLCKVHHGEYRLIDIGGDCMIRFGDLNVANISYLATYIHFIKLEKAILTIEGNISWPASFREEMRFYVSVNGQEEECDLYPANLDLKLDDGTVYEDRRAFKAEIPVLEDKRYEIRFLYECNGIKSTSGKINSMRFAPVADVLENQYCVLGDHVLYIQKNALVCESAGGQSIEDYEANYREEIIARYPKEGEWIINLRKKQAELNHDKKKPIWLFIDRPDKADDNAEIFFEYMQGHPEIDSYFILSRDSVDYERLAKIGKVVEFYSEQHYLLVLCADYIISSQCNGAIENPFWDLAEPFRDLYHRSRRIFLQHGIIKDDMSGTLNRFNTGFHGFITSTDAEYRSIIEYPYFYTAKEVWKTGLPLLDVLENKPRKIILIAPTWRKSLMHQEWDPDKRDMKWIINPGLEESEYYKRYKLLLNDKKLIRQCKWRGYRIAFMPHPLMAEYFHGIIENRRVEFWGSEKSYKEAISQAAILITDYSSLAMEFAYLQKPVIYYQFDREEFRTDHTYRKGYYDYKRDGFGEIVETQEELRNIIHFCIKDKCRIKDGYRQRAEELFDQEIRNKGCCERILNKMRG